MASARETVVVVHGLWMPGIDTLLLKRRLDAAGFAARRFNYRSIVEGLGASAARLAAWLAEVPGGVVHFVGHSLGGVLVLETLARHEFARAGRVVCLGSPLVGSRAAQGLLGWPGGTRMLGRCMQELLANGGVQPWCGRAEVGVIAGDLSIGLGRVLCKFDGPNDGTVAVAETRLAGATDHIVLPISHYALLWSRQVSRQVACFLRDGAFARDGGRSTVGATRSPGL
jgi:pimeloyl-ACP methyl ester carboxylesterase